MEKINAVITGVGGYVPDYVLTNDEISKMVDTTDEWIMTRIGVKERRILSEEGLGTSYMARKAAKQLMQKTGANPDEIDAILVATTTPDYHFPSTASILCDKLGLKNAFALDIQAACCSFLFGMETAASLIASGRHKKAISAANRASFLTAAFLRSSSGSVIREISFRSARRSRMRSPVVPALPSINTLAMTTSQMNKNPRKLNKKYKLFLIYADIILNFIDFVNTI